ncbi:MAG: hypothetical protein IPP94_06185 [Ignavibacteria bacterium]|nr:hypothetical protein [Ignavibacteria bacterium]
MSSAPGTALIAIGGNSLIRAGERGTIDEQLANAHATARSIARMVKDGWRVVITHGNGPQVGAALLRSERAAGEVYTHPLDVCVATTQSEIGYLLQRAMEEELRRIGLTTPVMTVLTQVRVDPADPAFQNPTKPIGPFYSKKIADEKRRAPGGPSSRIRRAAGAAWCLPRSRWKCSRSRSSAPSWISA